MTQLSERHAFKVNKIPVIKQTKENYFYSTCFVRSEQNFLQLVAISELDRLFCFVSWSMERKSVVLGHFSHNW